MLSGLFVPSLVRKAGLGHILLPPNFTIESTPFIGKFVSELPQAVPASGVVVLNADDSAVAAMAGKTAARVVRVSRSDPGADLYADGVVLDELARARFTLHRAEEAVPVQLAVFGDHQVSTVTAEVEARTAGIPIHRPIYLTGRTTDVDPGWGLATLTYPGAGGALIVWDSGAATPPITNTAPGVGADPHSDPRNSALGRQQKSDFLQAGGAVTDVCAGTPCVAP